MTDIELGYKKLAAAIINAAIIDARKDAAVKAFFRSEMFSTCAGLSNVSEEIILKEINGGIENGNN